MNVPYRYHRTDAVILESGHFLRIGYRHFQEVRTKREVFFSRKSARWYVSGESKPHDTLGQAVADLLGPRLSVVWADFDRSRAERGWKFRDNRWVRPQTAIIRNAA